MEIERGVDVDDVVSLDLVIGIAIGCRALLLNLRFDSGEGLEGVDGDVEIEGGEAEDGDGAGRKDAERRTLWKREGK